MRLIQYDMGVLELRWTWLPYWLVISPTLKLEVERILQDAILLNGIRLSEDSLDKIDRFVLDQIVKRFPVPGLKDYLRGLHKVRAPEAGTES